MVRLLFGPTKLRVERGLNAVDRAQPGVARVADAALNLVEPALYVLAGEGIDARFELLLERGHELQRLRGRGQAHDVQLPFGQVQFIGPGARFGDALGKIGKGYAAGGDHLQRLPAYIPEKTLLLGELVEAVAKITSQIDDRGDGVAGFK